MNAKRVASAPPAMLQVPAMRMANDRSGSIASFERGRHVCFTPDFGRVIATQRTDALGQEATSTFWYLCARSIPVITLSSGVNLPSTSA